MAFVKELHEVTACIYKQGDEKRDEMIFFVQNERKQPSVISSLPEDLWL